MVLESQGATRWRRQDCFFSVVFFFGLNCETSQASTIRRQFKKKKKAQSVDTGKNVIININEGELFTRPEDI